MAQGTEFPSFLSLKAGPDAAAEREFLSAIDGILGSANRKIRDFSGEAQRQLDAALSVNRNQSGSLDLGVAEMREALAVQQARSIAAREVSQALNLTAREEQSYTQEMREQIAASRALVAAEEAREQSLRSQIAVLDQVQDRLNRQASATDMVVAAQRRGTNESGNVINGVRAERTAFVQLGQQMQDVVIQSQMGTSALTIFTQQVPQAAFALSGLADSSNKTKAAVGNFATFLSGPWGAVMIGATALLGPLVAGILGFGRESEKSKEKSMSLVDALDRVKFGTQEATKAIDEYLDAKNRERNETEKNLTLLIESAKARIAETITIREQIEAIYELERAQASRSSRGAGGGTDPLLIANDRYATASARNAAALASAQKALNELSIQDAKRSAQEAVDPIKRINRLYDDMARAAEKAAAGNAKLTASLKDTLIGFEKQRKAALDAQKAKDKSDRKTPAATKENMLAQFAMPFPSSSISSGFGKRSRPMAGASANHGGIDFAQPIGAAVKAPQVGVVKSVGFSPTLGKYVVIDHGAGTQTRYGHLSDNSMVREGDAVAKGDVIGKVGSTGRSTGPHLHYEVMVNGKKVDPTKGLFPIDEVKVQENVDRAIEAQMRAYQQIAEEQARSRDSVEGMLIQQERQIEIQELLIQGRESEADALELQYRVMDQLGIKDAELLDTALEIAGIRRETYDQMQRNLVLQRQQNREEEEARRLQQRNLQAIAGIKDSIARTIYEIPDKGIGAIGGFVERLQDQFQQDLADSLTESLFGDAFKSMEETLRDSKKAEADSSLSAARALNTLARAADKAAIAQGGDVAGIPGSIVAGLRGGVAAGSRAANDNDRAITVLAQRLQDFSDPRRLYAMAFEKLGQVVFGPENAKRFGEAIGSALEGAAYGQMGGGLVGARSTEGKVGSSIGGMLGQEAGKSIFKALGSFAGPLGGLIGGALGGIFGGLFKKTTSGAVSLGVNQFGAAGISNTIGNSAAIQKEATGFGGAVAGSLNRIAEALGATVGDFSVAIGKRSSGWIKVSASGNAQATTGKKVTSDIIYNGKDEAEAIRAALLNAIQDGAIKGIREGAQRLLKAGSDIEAQLQKAMDFQSVFDRLKAYKDPVGAALDTLNREFEKLKRTFAEAGASTAEYAELEELYGIERAKAVKDAAQRVTGSLQALFDDLMIGDTGLSLRDRRANAKAAYDPLAARVAAGDVSAYDDYVKAAQALLDIERQISGSQQAYFDLRDEVARLTKSQIDAQQAKIDAATNSDSPFSNTAAGNDNQGVIDALDRLGAGLLDGLGFKLDAVNDNLGALLLASTGGGRVYNLPALSYENYF